MIASHEETIDECLSIEISEIMGREIMEDLRLEGVVEFPDIGEFLCISHHFTEIIPYATSLSSHDLSQVIRATYRVYSTREETHETIREFSEILFENRQSRIFLRREDDRFTIADTIFIESEFDAIGQDEFRISEIPRKLFGFLDFFEPDMHIFCFSIGDRKGFFSFSLEKYEVRLPMFTSFRLIDNMELRKLGKEISKFGTIRMLGGMTRGK